MGRINAEPDLRNSKVQHELVARLGPGGVIERIHVRSRLQDPRGNPGYMAPEFFQEHAVPTEMSEYLSEIMRMNEFKLARTAGEAWAGLINPETDL